MSECSAQVVRMRSIYAAAESVLVAIDSAAALRHDGLLRLLSLVEPTMTAAKQSSAVTGLLEDASIQATLVEFCSDRYWNRIWIVQEFAIGHNVQFLVGDSVVAASKLGSILALLRTQPQAERWAQALAIYRIRDSFQTNKPLPLLDALVRTRRSLCQRRHDRVFGIIGLSPDALKYLAEPNYEMDLAQTSKAMTRSYIMKVSPDIVFLGPHSATSESLPSWCVNWFHFDQHPPDIRVVTQLVDYVLPATSSSIRFWIATGSSTPDLTFREDSLLTAANRIGTIRSLGSTWSHPADPAFPTHDPNWISPAQGSWLCKEMYALFMRAVGSYRWIPRWYISFSLDYSFTRAFLESHDTGDEEHQHDKLLQWIRANRNFYTGDLSLSSAAKRLWHPFWTRGIFAFDFWLLIDRDRELFREDMSMIARTDMRLMGLDSHFPHRMGWAAPAARLYDEVFLIPGCRSPAILRPTTDGKYRLVGDAIVIGAMMGEVWKDVTAEQLQHIEIV